MGGRVALAVACATETSAALIGRAGSTPQASQGRPAARSDAAVRPC